MSANLPYSFYNRPVEHVAHDLIGCRLIIHDAQGIITETEAYGGLQDEASHAFRGPTLRSSIMFGPAGIVYVYLIYGMYFCLNIVTGPEGEGSAVLIRGLRLPDIHLDGPGKLCRYLGITKEHQGINVCTHPKFYFIKPAHPPGHIALTPRIGISKAKEKLWRFVLSEKPEI